MLLIVFSWLTQALQDSCKGRGRVRVRVGMGCGLRWGEVGAEAGKGWGGGRVGLYLAAKVGVTSDIDSRRSFAAGRSFPAREGGRI